MTSPGHTSKGSVQLIDLSPTSSPSFQLIETPEEISFRFDGISLDASKYTPQEKKLIVSSVACALPRHFLPPPPSLEQSTSAFFSSSLSINKEEKSIKTSSLSKQLIEKPNTNSSDDFNVDVTSLTWSEEYLLALTTILGLDNPPHTLLQTLLPLLAEPTSAKPFLSGLPLKTLEDKTRFLLVLLSLSVGIHGGYDARVRLLLRNLARELGVRWRWFTKQENNYAVALRESLNEAKKSNRGKDTAFLTSKWLKIGAAALVGGTLLAVTGGLAAPALAPFLGLGLSSIGLTAAGGTLTAFALGSTGFALITALFGGIGAGLAGYKMNRRVGALAEFEFEKLCINDGSMEVMICFNGWLGNANDYHQIWRFLPKGRLIDAEEKEKEEIRKSNDKKAQDYKREKQTQPQREKLIQHPESQSIQTQKQRGKNNDGMHTESRSRSPSPSSPPGLAEYSEVYVLKWETPILIEYGASLHSISASGILTGFVQAQLKDLLIKGLLAAIAWPMTLVSMSNYLDSIHSVILDRATKAATELADVIEKRIAGRRPLTLCGYSMGARVIFLALEELARRKEYRAEKRSKLTAEEQEKLNQQAKLFAKNKHKKSNKTTTKNNNNNKESNTATEVPVENSTSTSISAMNDGDGYSSLDPLSPLHDVDGCILDVFLFGTPIENELIRWLKVRSVVSGRLVNGFCRDDWLLKFIYAPMTVSFNIAGLRPIKLKTKQEKEEEAEAEANKNKKTIKIVEEPKEEENGKSIGNGSINNNELKNDDTISSSNGNVNTNSRTILRTSNSLSALLTEANKTPVMTLGIENVDLTGVVNGHTDYPDCMEIILELIKAQP